MPQPHSIDVFVVGESSESIEPPAALESFARLTVIPAESRSVAEFATAPVALKLFETEADFAALVFDAKKETLVGVATAAHMMAMMATLDDVTSEAQAAHITVERIDAGLLSEFLSFPKGSRVLLAPRARHRSVVFSREALRGIERFRPVAEPVWDWVIRAFRDGRGLQWNCIETDFRSTADRLPLLAPPRPGKGANWLLEHLAAASSKAFGTKLITKVDEIAIRAGLFQWHDFLDESHELSQSIEGQGENQLGDYWHAIMHRREPDYSNAKYWFRRIGNQPTWRDLRLHADAVLAECSDPEAAVWRDRLQAGSKWNPLAFVDLCEECAADETSDLAIAARRIQYAEMYLLM